MGYFTRPLSTKKNRGVVSTGVSPVSNAPAPNQDPLQQPVQPTVQQPVQPQAQTANVRPGSPGSDYVNALTPTAVAYPTLDSNAPPIVPNGQSTTNAFSNSSSQNGVFFNGVPNDIRTGYQTTLGDALSGRLYDPIATKNTEAEARLAANKRAGVAGKIASAGFTGSGVAAQATSATEDDLARQRFDSNIGIETARNASRLAALPEARAYGTSELSASESALERAVEYGSDADVASAYKQAYGRDLDPMALKETRAQIKEAKAVALETSKTNLKNLKNTVEGESFASYVALHTDWRDNPNLALQDQAFMNSAQTLWEAKGGKGVVPSEWAIQQLNTVNDPKLTNEFVSIGEDLKTAVKSGVMTQDAADAITFLSLPANAGALSQFIVKDKNGKPIGIDYNAMKTSVVGGNAGTTVNNNNAPAAPSTIPKGKQIGDIFIGSDGKTYSVVDDGEGNPAVEYTPTTKADFSVKKGWGASNWDNPDMVEGNVVRATVNGKEQSLKITKIAKKDVKLGIDTPYIEFIGDDGKQYYVEEDGKIKLGSAPKTGRSVLHEVTAPVQTSNKTINTLANTFLPSTTKAGLAILNRLNPFD